jgi:hypothetical protein
MEVRTNSRSCEKIWGEIVNSVRENIHSGAWRIRSSSAMGKIRDLILRYIREGDFSAYATLAKLKVMIHHGKAIYDIEEVK